MNLLMKLPEIKEDIENFIPNNSQELEQYRIKYLSKKGILSDLFLEFKEISGSDRKKHGQQINFIKDLATAKYEHYKDIFSKASSVKILNDISRPGEPLQIGSRHPISLIKSQIVEIFYKLGFSVSEGPEIEDDWHVFSALNFPLEHPARDMQDTFFIQKNPDVLLRTHTSSVQIRAMQKLPPPLRIIMPGRVFRNEAISARAHCIFHQVEGLYIDKNVSFADLKQTLLFFAREMFGEKAKIRLRPSFFPFTEPSAEVDVSCNICNGSGCNVCKYSGWLEILGCGMVHPNVLDNSQIDSKIYTGYAFGMGIERIAMLKYEVRDLRLYFENDIRFLRQFHSVLY
jgi:phenylalanyl-tRNA synthetase alpha chain